MTVFIYEHLTSGALINEPFSPALMHEGDAMLTALSQDLLALGLSVVVMRDARLAKLAPHPRLSVHTVSSPEGYQKVWQDSLQNYPQCILIAPEIDGVLYELATEVEQQAIQHLGSSPEAIRLCSDKLLTFQRLSEKDILTPDTMTADNWPTTDLAEDNMWVIKPRDGAGCEQTYKLNTEDLKKYVANISPEKRTKHLIQPYIPGETLSLSLFLNTSRTEVLSVNRQVIEETAKQLHLHHCLPGCEGLIAREVVEALVTRIRATIPDLWGFVGIDLILAEQQLWVIEINPRLTSSYAEPDFRKHRNPALALHQSIHA
jgi:predicted ATP-grasp superfamily ATP-dependent carboligase